MKVNLYFLFMLAFFGLGFLPVETAVGQSSGGGQYFGGRHNLAYSESTCNCKGNITNVHYIQDYATHQQIKLNYQYSKVYAHNDVNYSTIQIGSYNSTAQVCMEEATPSCLFVSSIDGTYSSSPGVGTGNAFFQTTKKFMAGTAGSFGGVFSNGNV